MADTSLPTSEVSATERILREIQRTLTDIRDDRAVLITILDRLDASIEGLNAELHALRSSQFDRFRIEVREDLRQVRDNLAKIIERLA
jgi:hypothetical protein